MFHPRAVSRLGRNECHCAPAMSMGGRREVPRL
jgi:hypothetical protein